MRKIALLGSTGSIGKQTLDVDGYPVERHLVTGFSRPIAQTGEMTIEATSVQDFPIATVMPLPGEEEQQEES